MANKINEKFAELHAEIKSYDGGVKKWIEKSETYPQAFYKVLKSKTATDHKREVYKIGVQVLKEMQREEDEFFKTLEHEMK